MTSRSSLLQTLLASVTQSHIANFEYGVIDKRHLINIDWVFQLNKYINPLPSQSWSCLIHVDLAYSIGGSKKMTWFCIRISCTIGLSVILPSININQLKTKQKKPELTFSFIRLSPRRLFVISRRGRSQRVSPSSTQSNSVRHTWMMCDSSWSRIDSMRLSNSATQ